MPGLDGLELQQKLASKATGRPIVFLTGHGSVPVSVRAMRAGAVDFLLKPVKQIDLLDAVERAAALDKVTRRADAERRAIDALVEKLTPREKEVLSHVIAGRLNKQIAADLGFKEIAHFYHQFKAAHGITPLEFARSRRETVEGQGRPETINVAAGQSATID